MLAVEVVPDDGPQGCRQARIAGAIRQAEKVTCLGGEVEVQPARECLAVRHEGGYRDAIIGRQSLQRNAFACNGVAVL